jgi:xanthine dehydrogenase large subunit
MKHLDAAAHVRGEAPFIDDLPEPPGMLHGAVVVSPVPHGRLNAVDPALALACEGVVAVLTAADVPGDNQIGNVIQDEPLFAEDELHFQGQPVALVLAEGRRQARVGAAAVELEIEELPGVFDPRDAAAAGDLIAPARTLSIGDVDAAWAECDVVVDGRADSGGQEHLYLETQAALAVPGEGRRIHLLSATQGPTAVQRIAARVLGLAMNDIEVEVTRLGGAFGGKEDQATPWAVFAALAAQRLRRPVKIALSRNEDCRMTGKRHPYSSDFRIGLRSDGSILAFEVAFYQNAGAAADLSTAVLQRSLFHATGAYHVPNARITGYSCRTNLPPFTAMRGFGAPQAMFVFDSAIASAAQALGIDRIEIQRKNLLRDGDVLPYGMTVANAHALRSFAELERRFDLTSLLAEVAEHNASHPLSKRGVAVMPVCFGISFTSTFLNQASALVHVYTDGSVSVSTAAVEMGQGVNTKIAAIAALSLGVSSERVQVESTSTTRIANTSPTAASSGADMNGGATRAACRMLVERLTKVAAEVLETSPERITIVDERVLVDGEARELGWKDLIWQAYTRRISLSAHAHFATPDLWYDQKREQGKPFAYHVFGAAVLEATVDCLRGRYTIDRVRIVHDAGRSLNPIIDLGQIEGALAQGIGWMTVEELRFEKGRNLSDTLMAYKLPDLMATPEVETVFLEDADNPAAVLHSKAVGEPPLMYGIGAYFAILDAMQAFCPELDAFFQAPMTPERVLMALHSAAAADRPARVDEPAGALQTTD